MISWDNEKSENARRLTLFKESTILGGDELIYDELEEESLQSDQLLQCWFLRLSISTICLFQADFITRRIKINLKSYIFEFKF